MQIAPHMINSVYEWLNTFEWFLFAEMLTITLAGIEREIATLQMEVGPVNRHLESGFSFIFGGAKI